VVAKRDESVGRLIAITGLDLPMWNPDGESRVMRRCSRLLVALRRAWRLPVRRRPPDVRGPRETPKPGLCDLPARTWHRWPTRRAHTRVARDRERVQQRRCRSNFGWCSSRGSGDFLGHAQRSTPNTGFDEQTQHTQSTRLLRGAARSNAAATAIERSGSRALVGARSLRSADETPVTSNAGLSLLTAQCGLPPGSARCQAAASAVSVPRGAQRPAPKSGSGHQLSNNSSSLIIDAEAHSAWSSSSDTCNRSSRCSKISSSSP